ncbi:MAG: FadR family transcriptional regulator [Spirochaetales bacterium]|nr:FadR family transcriptional regulator [Spirochaetales bacterium]
MRKEIKIAPIKRERLNDVIVKRLVTLIQRDLKPGDKLPSEKLLLEQLNIGRSSLREALRAVEALGLIEVRAGAGSYVTEIEGFLGRKPVELGLFRHHHSISDMIEAREIIEIAIVDLVVRNITEQQLEEMEEVVQRMETATPPDLEQHLSCDVRFHELLNKATGNTVLYELVSLVYNIVKEVRKEYFSSLDDFTLSCRYHRNILEALKRRDLMRARKAMQEHMDWVRRVFLNDSAGTGTE